MNEDITKGLLLLGGFRFLLETRTLLFLFIIDGKINFLIVLGLFLFMCFLHELPLM
jgi:hypothetical protein